MEAVPAGRFKVMIKGAGAFIFLLFWIPNTLIAFFILMFFANPEQWLKAVGFAFITLVVFYIPFKVLFRRFLETPRTREQWEKFGFFESY